VPTVEFRHAGDKYADLIQEAIDNLGLEFSDVKSSLPEDDPPTHMRHNGGLTAPPATSASFAGPLRLGMARPTDPRYTFDAFVIGSGNQVRPRRLPGRR